MKRILILSLLLALYACGDKPNANKIPFSSEGERNEIRLFDILMSEETGINFVNKLTESLTANGLLYQYYYNGGGVAVADFNNDGLQDAYFVSNLYSNALYLNEGDLKFRDVSVQSGATNIPGYPTGVTAVDINTDGLMDLYISVSGRVHDSDQKRNKLLVNQGIDKNGIPTFKEEGAKYGLDLGLCSTQAAFFDYDLDNDLDMFLINHFPEFFSSRSHEELMSIRSKITGDRLYENRDGKFVEVSKEAGIINNRYSYGLGVAIADLNNDGWPDIYVSNDYQGKDLLYMNNGNGTFSETGEESLGHMSYASMGNNMADFNNDGWFDIFTLDMMAEDNYGIKTSLGSMDPGRFYDQVNNGLHYQYMYNTLQMNNGVFSDNQIPVFSDIAQISGISSTGWSWAPLVFDMDNDGFQDLFVSNGIKRDFVNNDYNFYAEIRQKEIVETGNVDKNEYITSVLKRMPNRKESNYFYKNMGDLTFKKMNQQWANEILTCSNGAAYADFDNDGDMDIILNNSDSESFIYRNTARENRLGNYLQFQFEGPENNPNGIGARIMVRQRDQIQMQDQFLSRGFQSSVSPILHFGLGAVESLPEVTVIWPDGKKQVIENVKSNQVITLSYSDANEEHNYIYRNSSLFSDVTSRLKLHHRHVENEFNDYERENLLPHKMSAFGPALAVGDVNDDGLDDFYVGGAKGYSGELYTQTKRGFTSLGNQPWQEDKECEDVKAIFFDVENDGDLDLYVVSGSNEAEEGSPNLEDRLYLNIGSDNFTKERGTLPQLAFSGGCVEPADFDNDGDLDLFVGGRQKPGSYPFPVTSHILRNESEPGEVRFVDVTSELAPQLESIGMVSGANWVDINSDGNLELVVVGEWMSVRIFQMNENSFEDITDLTGLTDEVGWWSSVTSGDFDGDGDMDLVAGNLGLNYKYKASKEKPFEVYAKDFDNNGKKDIVLAYFNEGDQLFPLRGRECSSNQMPFIKQKYPTYDAFGRANLLDVYGTENLESALNYKAKNFATSYIENKGEGKFEIRPLDNLAQISSVNGIIAEDVDRDGNLDIIIAGNMHGSEVETTRNDASIGLFLRGNGSGDFEPVPAHICGLQIKGDVKDIKMIRLGENGSRAILAAKNNDLLQLVEIGN